MSKQKIPKVTVPLVSYIQPGTSEPIKTKRLRPEDALDIALLIKELEASTIVTKMIKDNPWSIISVFSPYSIDFHVMLMETGMRYIPSPEYVEDNEVEDLMSLWIKIIQFMKDRDKNQRIFIGYNWSPRSWGKIEEAGGFQSIPTKWHPMFWSWPVFTHLVWWKKLFLKILPAFNKDSQLPYLSWENHKNLELPFRRMNGDNNFVAPIAKHIKYKADELIKKAFGENIVKKGTSISNNYGFSVTFNCGLETLLGHKGFFRDFLKPLSIELDDFFAKLTEAFLEDYKSSEIDNKLKKTDKGKLNNSDTEIFSESNTEKFSESDLDDIRYCSPLKDEDVIKNSLVELSFTPEAIKELIDIVRNRCQDKLPAWRKGFAYALVFEELKDLDNNEETKLKIVPAAYLGSGGIVEATGVVLKRPENAKLPIEQCRKKSKELYPLINIINGKNEICPQCKKKSLRYWSEGWEEDRSRIVDPMWDLVEYNRKEHVICDECGYKDTQNFTYYYNCQYDNMPIDN